MSHIILVPAYGRVYTNVDDMLNDWTDGKDFKFPNGGPYTSIRDLGELTDMGQSLWLQSAHNGFPLSVRIA